ncbi:hypothetical protein [Aliiroseovarius sp. YM-037]|uniref:hypothetical protein n=1 Tax=Aliiroseovarius sp. YM-037 TaxID=3341728 RepID=UPI003A812359
MTYKDLNDFLRQSGDALSKGPIALIFVEDEIEVESTIRHHVKLGFKTVLVFAPAGFALAEPPNDTIHVIPFDIHTDGATQAAVNRVISATPGNWVYYCYNAEYLFFPFCEHRTVGEMLTHTAEERREAVLCYVVDLYAGDLRENPSAVSLDDAFLDNRGYYALARKNPEQNYEPKERQLDFFGGLRWRFEEHVPYERRKIDRIALFKAKPGLKLLENHTLTDEEMNTYSCPWHHNMTAAICSFRTAKALKSNPGSRFEIDTFRWRNSTQFDWNSQQLLDLGLIEPGQWF